MTHDWRPNMWSPYGRANSSGFAALSATVHRFCTMTDSWWSTTSLLCTSHARTSLTIFAPAPAPAVFFTACLCLLSVDSSNSATEGVYTVDTCFAFEEGVTTFYDSAAANTEAGTLSVQYVCNITSGELVPTWYSDDECGEADGFVTLEVAVDTCTATCTEDGGCLLPLRLFWGSALVLFC